MKRWLWMVLGVVLGCGAPEERPIPGRPAPAEDLSGDPGDGVSQPAGTGDPAIKDQDGKEISRGVGKPGGLVVFWPRVIPRTTDPAIRDIAAKLQERLVAIARSKYGEDAIDVRPEPERVCPRQGCKGATLGVLLAHVAGKGGSGCVAVALVAEPGTSPMKLVPWAGVVKLKKDEVGFREFPESQLTIHDSVPCESLVDSLAKGEKEIQAAL